MGKRERTQHESLVLQQCSNALPSIVLMEILSIKPKMLSAWRKELDATLTLSQSKAVTSSFLAELPNLHTLPLTDAERKTVRLYRLDWINRRSKDEQEEHSVKRIKLCSPLLPTRAIAALLAVPANTVLRLQTSARHCGLTEPTA